MPRKHTPRTQRIQASSPRKNQAPTERVQKLLSAAGVGSRREVERWIREGRLQVNGEVPALGAKLTPRDRITLDGRPVRLHTPAVKELRVLLFHRSPGETLDLKAATSRAAEHLNLPRASGRWLAIQPMPPVDGGLEILTDDGSWAHRVSQGVHALTIDYVLRMRGPLKEDLVEEFRAATDCEGEAMSILQADAQFGEGFNHWLNVTVRDTRSAQVRHWWAARGIIVSRLMRVRFGPVHLSRDLPRGHSRAMLASERNALINEIDAAKPAAVQSRRRRTSWRRLLVPAAPFEASSNCARYCCHTAAQVWVPWPWVWSEAGSSTKRPFLTRLISRSAMPSSGGLMKSSAELICSQWRLDLVQAGRRIVVARGVDLVQKIVGVQILQLARHVFFQEFIRGIAGRQGDLHLNGRAAGDQQQPGCGAQGAHGLARVVALQPLRILANRIHDQIAPQAVASRNLHRKAGERHQRIHEIRIGSRPT